MLTNDQLEMRKSGITATDLGAILGINPYKTALEVYLDKIGEGIKVDLTDNQAVYWGVKLEPLIADRYAEINNVELVEIGTIRHKDYPYIMCTPDRLIKGANKGLEIKTAGVNALNQWDKNVPQHYFMQACMCMLVMNYQAWDICCLFAGQDLRTYTLLRDKEFDDLIIEACTNFWHNHVLARVEPQVQYHHPHAIELLKKKYPAINDESILVPQEIESSIERWQNAKETAKQYQHAAEAEEALILEFMKEAASGQLHDGRVLKRTLVKIPEKTMKAYEYVRLSISKLKRTK